jgi:hypothetical protein
VRVLTKSEIVTYIRDELLPIVPVSSESATLKGVEEAIRWYDREGATLVYEQFDFSTIITLPSRVDQVLDVIMDHVVNEIFTAQTLLLGVTILDYDILTLALKQNHLADLRTFLASRTRWRWIKPYLHFDGNTQGTTYVIVKYLKHYDYTSATDDISSSDSGLDWIIRYSRAKFKQAEGRILRMGSVINTPMDGSEMYREGTDELKEVKDELIAKRPLVVGTRTF